MAAQESTALAPREGPVGQPLGVRRKPQLRLALGYRDETKKGAPVKTDYFIPKGNPAAVEKFLAVHRAEYVQRLRGPGATGQQIEKRVAKWQGPGASDIA